MFTGSGSPASTGLQNQTPLAVQKDFRSKWHGPRKAVLATLLRSDFLICVVPIDPLVGGSVIIGLALDSSLAFTSWMRYRLGFQNDKMLTTSFVPTWTCLVSSHPGQSLEPCAGPRSTSLRHAYTKTNSLGSSSHTLRLQHNPHPSASCALFHLDLGLSGSTLFVRLA